MSGLPVRIVRIVARMNVGGPARQIIELSKGLSPRGFETFILTGEPAPWEGDLREEAERAGARMYTIPGLGARVRPAGDAVALWNIIKLLKSLKPDVVHTHTAKAGFLGRVAGRFMNHTKRVHTFHGTVFNHYFSPAVSKIIQNTERVLAKKTDRIVAVSHAVADEVERIGVPLEKIRVIEPVIDLEPFLKIEHRRGDLRVKYNILENEYCIGWAGRFVNIKDPASFLNAAALVAAESPEARFVMIGAGPLEGEMRALALKLNIQERVVFVGMRGDMAAAYADFDLLVNSSLKEGMPVSLLEGMAAGVPIVATAAGGTPELVAEERSAFLVPAGDARVLARAILRWVALSPGEKQTMRRVSRVRAREKFGLARGLDRHEMLYRELLS